MTNRFKARLDRIERKICPPRMIYFTMPYGATEAERQRLAIKAAGEEGIGPNDICVGLVEFDFLDRS
jgi:hypothetical protein